MNITSEQIEKAAASADFGTAIQPEESKT